MKREVQSSFAGSENDHVFILRVWDKLAEPAIKMYWLLVTSHRCQSARVLQIEIELEEPPK